MPHLLLIVEAVGQRAARGVERGKAGYQQMLNFTDARKRSGVLMAGRALATAATHLQRPQGTAGVRETKPGCTRGYGGSPRLNGRLSIFG